MNVWQYLDHNNLCGTVNNALDNLRITQDERDEVVRTLKRFAFAINHRAKSRFGVVKFQKVVKRRVVTHEVMELTSEYFTRGYELHEDRADNHMQTLLHETAHIIIHVIRPKAEAHGREWKSVMRALGAKADRTGSATFLTEARQIKQPASKKHAYHCDKCDYVYRCNRRLKNISQRRHGSGCGGNFIHRQVR